MEVDNIKPMDLNESQNEKLKKIKLALKTIENKDVQFMFVVSSTPNPAASIYEIYYHATVVKELGYNVKILTDVKDYEIPTWIEKTLTDIEHESLEESKLSVGPEDVLVIPEVFSNVMEQTKNLPCIRVGLLQSIDYMYNALIPGTSWSNFGIKNVLTTSDTLKEIFEETYGKNIFDVKTYKPVIPNYFKKLNKPKKPIISIVGRNPNEVSKVVKMFYAKFPQYSWITFDTMLTESNPPKPLSRKQFAHRLANNFAGLWIDRISSFGTFPLECMKTGTIPVCLLPDVTPDYMLKTDEKNNTKSFNENAGVWTRNIYELAFVLGNVVNKFLDDTIDDEFYKTMDEVGSYYGEDISKDSIKNYYQTLLDDRKKVFETVIEKFDKPKDEENNKKDTENN